MDKSKMQHGFANLSSELILSAVEACSFVCTGRYQQLNSMENRVFTVEIDAPETRLGTKQLVVKFYRPERWNAERILSEHAMLHLLSSENIFTPRILNITDKSMHVKSKIPFKARVSEEFNELFSNMQSLGTIGGYNFSVWEKLAGRGPLELSPKSLDQIGSTVGRMHNLFEAHIVPEYFDRPFLCLEEYIARPMQNLQKWNKIPRNFEAGLYNLIEELHTGLTWLENSCHFIPVHGDLHRMNLLQTSDAGEFWFVDFDDSMCGPEVQDLWLLASTASLSEYECTEGEDPTETAFNMLSEGYNKFRKLSRDSDKLIEPLRTLRMVYYMGWIAGRWYDPFFRETFTFFTDETYWEKSYFDLIDQREKLLYAGLLDFS